MPKIGKKASASHEVARIKMELKQTHKKLSKTEIERFENDHGIMFRDSFKEFYLKSNGGAPMSSFVIVDDGTEEIKS